MSLVVESDWTCPGTFIYYVPPILGSRANMSFIELAQPVECLLDFDNEPRHIVYGFFVETRNLNYADYAD